MMFRAVLFPLLARKDLENIFGAEMVSSSLKTAWKLSFDPRLFLAELLVLKSKCQSLLPPMSDQVYRFLPKSQG